MHDKTIRSGSSKNPDPLAAVEELHSQLAQPDMALVVFHCSTVYDLEQLGAAISDAFPGTTAIGCTSAGEIGLDGYQDGGISGYSLARSAATVVTHHFDGLREFSVASGQKAVVELRARLGAMVGDAALADSFAILLIDGMSQREEVVTRAVRSGLGEISLVGGSAGDDMAFARTFIFCDGRFHADGAVLALVHTHRPFTVFKTQHFVRSAERMVVTHSIPDSRTVTEINGFPAATEYARANGLAVDSLNPMMFAAYPVLVRIGNAEYVRSIQRVTPEGDLIFYCAIDTGIVLSVATGVDLVENLANALADVTASIGPPRLIIACDCILRKLEIAQKGLLERTSALLRRHNVVGFNTYGEQFNGMHVNQTFTGIAIGGEP